MRAVLMNQEGSMYVELMVCLMVLFSVFAMLLTIPPVFVYKQSLDLACRQIAFTAAELGSVGENVQEFAESICETYGLDGQVSFYGELDGDKVQLRNKFTTELKGEYQISLGRIFGQDLSFSIEMVSKTESMGRRYIK